MRIEANPCPMVASSRFRGCSNLFSAKKKKRKKRALGRQRGFEALSRLIGILPIQIYSEPAKITKILGMIYGLPAQAQLDRNLLQRGIEIL